MGHSLVRGSTIPKVVEMITEKYNVDEIKALDMFYTSITAANYSDDETGLYAQSALYIFGMFTKEIL